MKAVIISRGFTPLIDLLWILDIKRLICIDSHDVLLIGTAYITIDQRPKIESVNYDSIQIPVINALSQSQPKASNNQAFDYKIIGTRIGVYGDNSSVVLKRTILNTLFRLASTLKADTFCNPSQRSSHLSLCGRKIVIRRDIP